MSTRTSPLASASGLFGLLAQRQLGRGPGRELGALRPRRPYAVEEPPSTSVADTPEAVIESEMPGVAASSLPRTRAPFVDRREQEIPSPRGVLPTLAPPPQIERPPRQPSNRLSSSDTAPTLSRVVPPPTALAPATAGPRAAEATTPPPERVRTHDRIIAVERAATRDAQPEQPPLAQHAPIARQPAAPPPRVRPRLPSLPAMAPPRDGETGPDIEIHIGRVEVRAHASPVARSVAEAPAPTIADHRLAAYLRRRGAGGRS